MGIYTESGPRGEAQPGCVEDIYVLDPKACTECDGGCGDAPLLLAERGGANPECLACLLGYHAECHGEPCVCGEGDHRPPAPEEPSDAG